MERVNDIERRVEEISSGFNISIESILQIGFNQFRKAPGEMILYGLITAIAFSNPLSGLLLGGPLVTGYYIFAHSLKRGGTPEFRQFFRSFDRFTPLFLLHLLTSLLVGLGFLLLILPGVYFSVSYLFSTFFVWFHDVPPADAIRLSRKMVSGNFMQVLWLWLILVLINLLGAMAFGVGLLITIPLSSCILYAAFDDIIGIPN